MAHRLHHLQKRRVEAAETQEAVPSSTPAPLHHSHPTTHSPAALRPAFPSTNELKPFDRYGFRSGQPAYPPPDSLYQPKDTEVDPSFLRTTSVFLHSQPRKSVLPIAAWITPFANERVPVVQLTAPLRCPRCKAYVNPYFQFDGTRKAATCNLCSLRFSIEQSIDRSNLQSTEIATHSVLDFRVSDKFYFKKRTDVVKLLAVVELSMPMIELGVFASVAAGLRSAFESHQFEAQVRVGVVFYSDQGVGFLRPGPPGSDPAVFLVTNNKSGIFCSPLSDEEYLLDPNSQREQLLGLVDFLEKYADSAWKQGRFNHTANYVNALRCIRDSFEQETGRVLLFSLLDPRSGPCCIRPRTEEESKSALKPIQLESQELGRELQRARIGVEHFVFSKDGLVSHQFATTHFLSSSTGGALHFYNAYNADTHGEHLYYSIFHTLTKACYYDVDFTCRASNGLTVLRFGAPDGLRETRDVGLSIVDSASAFTVELDQEEKLEENVGAFIQFALMYTTGHGERRIRVITYKFDVSSRLEPVYESVDYLTVAHIFLRTFAQKMLRLEPSKVREEAIAWLGGLLGEFRSKCGGAQSVRMGDVVAPSGLAWAFSYIHSFLNSRLFLNYTKISSDARINEFLKLSALNPYFFASRYYSHLYPLTLDIYDNEPLPGDFIQTDDPDEEAERIAVLPPTLPLTRASLADTGVYLHDSGDQLTILVQPHAPEDLLLELFGTANWEEIETGGLPELETSHSIRVANIIAEIRRRSSQNGGMFQPLLIKTPLKKGPYSELVGSLLREDSFECNMAGFLEAVARAVVIPK